MPYFPIKGHNTKKPTVPKLDKGHWFGRHVQSAFVPNSFIRNHDIAQKYDWPETTPASISYADNKLDLALDSAVLETSLPWSSWSEATIFLRYKVTTAINGDRFFSVYHSASDDIRLYVNSAGDVLVAWDDGSATTQTLTDGNKTDEFILIASHDGVTQRTWLYNTDTDTLTSASSSDTFSFSGLDGTTTIGGTTFNTSDADDSYYRYVYIADKAVTTDSQALDLIDNEYSVLEADEIFLPTAIGATVASLTAAATSADTFSAVATASASVTEGATAGDTPGGAAAATATMAAAATSADIQAALATAQAAITDGTVAGETWAADATALASILAAALSGDTFTGVVTSAGVQTGSLIAASTSEEQFLGAAQTIASITAGVLAGDTLTAVIRSVAVLTAAALAGDTQSGVNRAAAPLIAGAVSSDTQAGSAVAVAALTGDAVAGATFDIAGEIGRLVADIIIQAALDGAILIGKAIDGDVTIN